MHWYGCGYIGLQVDGSMRVGDGGGWMDDGLCTHVSIEKQCSFSFFLA